MPGSVSDSYDPEFSTVADAADVADAIGEVRDIIIKMTGVDPKDIVTIAQGGPGNRLACVLSTKSLQVIRYCLNKSFYDLTFDEVRDRTPTF